MHPTLNKKRGMALRFCSLWASGTKLSYSLHVANTKTHTQKIVLIGCISSSLDCFSITKKFRESFPARQTLHDNFLINDIGNAQFYRKLKYTCMQIWSNKIWYSHCPDLFVYTSSSLAFFLMQWVKSTVIFPLRPCFEFSCCQELFQQFLRDLSAKGIRLSVIQFNRIYMKLTKFVCDLSV